MTSIVSEKNSKAWPYIYHDTSCERVVVCPVVADHILAEVFMVYRFGNTGHAWEAFAGPRAFSYDGTSYSETFHPWHPWLISQHELILKQFARMEQRDPSGWGIPFSNPYNLIVDRTRHPNGMPYSTGVGA